MHHIRLFLACDEVASLVFGQAFARGADLGVLAIGVELLAGLGGRCYGAGGGEIYHRMNSLVQETVRILDISPSSVL